MVAPEQVDSGKENRDHDNGQNDESRFDTQVRRAVHDVSSNGIYCIMVSQLFLGNI